MGRKLDSRYQDEVGNRFNHRWLGRRIKHTMGPVSIKMYDKFNAVLRIETTVNNVSFFQHYRTVAHRDGTTSKKYAKMKKSIYSLAPLAETLETVNHRYLTFISAIDTPEAGVEKLHRLTETVEFKDHRYKDFNLLSEEDSSLLRHLLNGQFLIQGLSNKALRQLLPDKTLDRFLAYSNACVFMVSFAKSPNAIVTIFLSLDDRPLSWHLNCGSLSLFPILLFRFKHFLPNVQQMLWLGTN